jgi:7-carboxy-7-deazaguanine synthase
MTNQQTPRPANYDSSGILSLHSHFPTIQGEGPFTGERALFFRLADCNLRCPGCDTDYTSTRLPVGKDYMLARAIALDWQPGALIVITGGEPMRQNIAPAIVMLLAAGYRVQLETNGVLCAPDLPWLRPMFSVVVSPKTMKIADMVHQNAIAFKYVLRASSVDVTDGLPTRALDHPAATRVARPRKGAPVYLQPMDEGDDVPNALNLDACIRSVLAFGHKLQLQTHKITNML